MTMTTIERTTVKIPLAALREALVWVLAAADPDEVNKFSGVNFRYGPAESHPGHYDGGWAKRKPDDYAVSLAGTDRYRLAYSTIVCPGGAGAGIFSVPVATLKQTMKSWPKDPRGSHATSSAVFNLEQQAVEIFDPNGDLVGRFATGPDKGFPKYDSLLPDIPGEVTHAPGFTVNAKFLAQLAAAAPKDPMDKTSTIGLAHQEKEGRAVMIRTAWNSPNVMHSGLLMPVKMGNA